MTCELCLAQPTTLGTQGQEDGRPVTLMVCHQCAERWVDMLYRIRAGESWAIYILGPEKVGPFGTFPDARRVRERLGLHAPLAGCPLAWRADTPRALTKRLLRQWVS